MTMNPIINIINSSSCLLFKKKKYNKFHFNINLDFFFYLVNYYFLVILTIND